VQEPLELIIRQLDDIGKAHEPLGVRPHIAGCLHARFLGGQRRSLDQA
jgi:hypothetical protein